MSPHISQALAGMFFLSVIASIGLSDGVPNYALAASQTGPDPSQSGPPVGAERKAQALVEKAESLLFKGRYDEAEVKAREVLAIDPRNSRAGFVLSAVRQHAEYADLIATDATNNPTPRIELPSGTVSKRREAFESAVSKVMDRHGFTWPQFFDRKDGTVVAVCSRPRLKPLRKETSTSSWEVLQAVIETTGDNRVALELKAYCWHASSYALLGNLFTIKLGITRERSEIGRELQAELHR